MLKKILKSVAFGFVGLVLLIAMFAGYNFYRFSALSNEQYPMHPELAAALKADAKPDLEIGRRIYFVRNGCVDCHGADLSGVKVMENGAMGSIYGVNITPAKTKDLKDEDLARAIRYGVHHTGRSLRFMPSFDFQELSKDDLNSVIAFIRSVPAVEKPDHENVFGPVAKIMGALGKMPVVFPARFIDHNRGLGAKPPEGPTEEFGKYLANACTGCHGSNYLGGPIPGGDPSWPAASNIRLGALGWDRATFTNVIKTGIAKSTGQPIRIPMPIVALQQMNDTESEALWKYLSSLK